MNHPQRFSWLKISWIDSIRWCLAVSIALAICLGLPAKAYACACCASAGQWYEMTRNIDGFEQEQIDGVKFANTAKVYLTAAGFETIKGLESDTDTYTLSLSKNKRIWNLKLTDKKGKTGNLSLTLPTKAVFFATDLYDRPTPDSRLYKEVRLEGGITGNGIFAKGIARNTKYRLILQGRGNICLNTGDFKNWRLQVSGPQASYSLYGSVP